MSKTFTKLAGKRVLVVDDESDLRNIIADSFELLNVITFRAKSGQEALKLLETQTVDIILSDVRMPGGDGIAFLDAIRKQNPVTPYFILMTGYADITREDAMKKGANELFAKPFPLEDVFQFAERLKW